MPQTFETIIRKLKMMFITLLLGVTVLGNGVASTPVNTTSMINVGTINVDGVGPIQVVSAWQADIQVPTL